MNRLQITWLRARLFVALILLATVCIYSSMALPYFFPGLRHQEQDVRQLERVAYTLERLMVRDYLNSNGCRRIHYASGWFADPIDCTPHTEVSLNVWDKVTAKSLDEKSRTDFKAVEVAIETIGVPVYGIDAEYNHEGKLRDATFWLSCVCSLRYRYSPNYTYYVPEEVPGELWHTPIDKDWYMTDEEWN